MRVRSTFAVSRAEFNMTPMIDVVFLLVVFFLLSSHLARRENQLELPLPVARTGQQDTADQPKITLNLLADGQLLLSGKSLEQHSLAGRLEQAIARHGRQLELRLRADEQTPYRFVQPILRAAADSGLWNVNIAVTQEPLP